MPVTLIDNKGRKYEVSITEALLGRGRTIRSRKTSPKVVAKPSAGVVAKGVKASAKPTTSKSVTAATATPENPPSAPAANGATDTPEPAPAPTPAAAPASTPAPVPAPVTGDTLPNPPTKNEAASPAAPSTEPPVETQNTASNGNAAEWTADQDKQLLKLKEEGKTWNEIASIMGKFKKQVTSRYGELLSAKAKSKEPVKEEVNKKEEVVVVTVEEDTTNEVDSFGFNMNALHTGVDPNIDPSHPYLLRQQKNGGIGKEKKAKEPLITNWTEGNLSMSESVLLTRLHDYYEMQKWIEISARFFDHTGRRFKPQMLQEKMEEARYV